jgi:hypothetical protein
MVSIFKMLVLGSLAYSVAIPTALMTSEGPVDEARLAALEHKLQTLTQSMEHKQDAVKEDADVSALGLDIGCGSGITASTARLCFGASDGKKCGGDCKCALAKLTSKYGGVCGWQSLQAAGCSTSNKFSVPKCGSRRNPCQSGVNDGPCVSSSNPYISR